MTIKLEFNMPDDFFGDILCTAVEGGINYWAQIKVVTSNDDNMFLSAVIRPDQCEGEVFSDGDPRNDWQLVDHAKIEAAIQRILCEKLIADYIQQYIFDAVKEGDSGHIDVEAADAIIQIAMFGELVFG